MANQDGTKSIRLNSEIVGMVVSHKKATGVAIGRFIEDAITEKVDRLPAAVKLRMGLKAKKQQASA